MKFPRSSGILLHITSLPSRHGIGDVGPSAYEFADFLASAGQKLWQVLPLNPTGYGDSPYQCFSAFAGNHLLLSFELLQEAGILEPTDLASTPFSEDSVDYASVIAFKTRVLRRAAQVFFADASHADRASFERFCENCSSWLDDYALFMACKDVHPENTWATWDPPIRRRDPLGIQEWFAKLAPGIQAHKYWQFEFFRQWEHLKAYCQKRDICIMGDIPIYVAHDSSDVWAHTDLFQLNDRGLPTVVSGVPPDYFSARGQLWGNPIYRWDTLAANGRWMKGPGEEFLSALQNAVGELPIVAENLGVITPAVEKLRRQFGLPGMSLLQFAFGTDPQGPSFRPHNYSRDLVAYTGGHDNDTTVGWWLSSGDTDSTRTPEDVRKEHEFARAYLDLRKDSDINWVMIRAVLSSVADVAIVPLQDVLGLGGDARMNLPGTTKGNWKWRCRRGVLTDALATKLRSLTTIYDR